jgi:hypothetical protein
VVLRKPLPGNGRAAQRRGVLHLNIAVIVQGGVKAQLSQITSTLRLQLYSGANYAAFNGATPDVWLI